jgi:nucleoid DNA-binding protein
LKTDPLFIEPSKTQGDTKMTKRDLVMRIADETGLIQQDVYAVIQKSLDYIVEALENDDTVEFRNFGVFEVRERKQRIGRNPNKPENVVTIPARKVVKFKPGKIMRERITGE